MSVLIEELLDRKASDGRMAVVVLDSHGEYIGFKQTQYGKSTNVVGAKKFRIAFRKITPQMLAEWAPEISSTQMRELAPIMEALRKESKEKHEAYTLEDLIVRVESEMADKKKDNVKRPLLAWLSELRSLRLFGATDVPKLEEVVSPGMLTVFDLSEIDHASESHVQSSPGFHLARYDRSGGLLCGNHHFRAMDFAEDADEWRLFPRRTTIAVVDYDWPGVWDRHPRRGAGGSSGSFL